MDRTKCHCKHRNVNPLKSKIPRYLKYNTHGYFNCYCGESESVLQSNEIVLVKEELDKAYDIIAEMEFELESMDLLTLQNQWLRDELLKVKAEAVGVIYRDEVDDAASQKDRRTYRQQVSAGILEPELKSPTQDKRFGLILD